MPNLTNRTVAGFRGLWESAILGRFFLSNMPSNLSGIEDLVVNLIHDLRQPLSNLEGCSYYLTSLTQSGDARIQELAQVIERQVENAEQLLAAASLELSRTRGQRQETAASIDFTNPAKAGVT